MIKVLSNTIFLAANKSFENEQDLGLSYHPGCVISPAVMRLHIFWLVTLLRALSSRCLAWERRRPAGILTLALLCGMSGGCLGLKKSEVPQIVSAKKIWHGDHHNAFTDLIRFQGRWFCTFRESAAHVGGNGKIRVITSNDGEHWESSALLSEEGIDLRDPKLSITPDNRLMLVLGGSVYEGKTLKERQSRVAFSKDGKQWTSPQRVLEKGDWLWRVTWFNGVAYGIAYTSAARDAVKTDPSAGNILKLVASKDGIVFNLVTNLDVPNYPNESTLRFLKNGDCIALVRREQGDKAAWIGLSSAPYTDWKWNSAGISVGGPNFIILPDGNLIASGRDSRTAKAAKTFVGRMDLEQVEPDLILPSGGDCSYPGMVWYKNLLWVSYYSSHEGATDIYLAKIRLRK